MDFALGAAGGAAHDSHGDVGRLVAATAFTLGAPTVHALHGHWGKAAGSVLLHLPGALLIAQPKTECSGCLMGGLDGTTLLLALGNAIGVAIDSIVLANEDVPRKEPPAATVWVSPWASQRGAGVVLGARY